MNRIKDWINNHKNQTIAIVIILIIVVCSGIALTVTLINKSGKNAYSKEQWKTDFSAGSTDSAITNKDENNSTLADDSKATLTQPDTETTASDNSSNPEQSNNADVNSGAGANLGGTKPNTSSNSGSISGSTGHGNSSGNSDNTTAPHVHTWVNVSPENSYHTEYASECRIHGYSGEEPMFFKSQNDLFLHHAADGCNSSWGWGFKGIAYKYCSGCGEEVITGHVHDFGTIEKTIYSEKIICECGMSFSAGKDYTALESWESHVESYVSHGYPREDHDSYTTGTSSSTRYEATKTCSCGWRPVDNSPIY